MQAARAETPNAECPHCGEKFTNLKEGNIPTHDWPRPCRQVCPGSGEQPRRKHSPLWKDNSKQREVDFIYAARQELLIYGFAVVKNVAMMRGEASGTLDCPLCGQLCRYSYASSNDHVGAKCVNVGCINIRE